MIGRASPPASHGAAAHSGDRFTHALSRLAARLGALTGWRRRGAAFAAGLLSVLAMAPFFAWPVLWLTLPALVWLLDGAHAAPRRGGRAAMLAAAGIGWWFGFGYFLAGLFWIGEAFLVEAETFAIFLPLAVVAMPAGLALFTAAACALASPAWSRSPGGSLRVLALALTLAAAEWLRGHILTGFPWNVLGYALTYPLPLMQSAALIGIYGLTLAAVVIFALPPVLWVEAAGSSVTDARPRHRLALTVAILPLTLAALFGALRLLLSDGALVDGVKLRIVQPSVPQRDKWRPENQERIFFDHLYLSTTGPSGATDNLAGITHVVWPEAAMPFLPLDHPAATAMIGRTFPAGTLLITGALRAERAPPDAPRPRRIFNSLLVFGGETGALVALYDKIHLVPFGEYLPLQPVLSAIGLRQLTEMRGGFDVGETPRPLLYVPGLPPAVPLICYEVIFPAAIVQGAERPQLMLNVTNDGWFGDTTGPRQHLHQARVRAVEEGLPLVRAANNGISAMIDPYGRILVRLGLDARGSIDTPLPRALSPPLYARVGDWSFVILWLALFALAGALWRRSPPG